MLSQICHVRPLLPARTANALRSPAPMLCATLWTAVCFVVQGACLLPGAEPVVYRSTRMDLPRQLDELDLPRYGDRECHWGWETRTKHFVVFSTRSREDARQTAAQMEQAWAEFEPWASRFTGAMQRPTFGIGSVNVLIADEWVDPQATLPPGPNKMNYWPDIRLHVPRKASSEELDLAELRYQAVRSFFRVAQLEQAVPDWVQVGMAYYMSGQPLPRGRIAELPPPPVDRSGPGTWSLRTAADRAELPRLNPRWAGLWVAYFMEGDDAAHLPEFLDALSKVVATRQQDPFVPAAGVRQASRSPHGLRHYPADPLGHLARRLAKGGELRTWLVDRQAGQPVLDPEADIAGLDEAAAEIAFVLKLLARFGMPGPVTSVVEFKRSDNDQQQAAAVKRPASGQSLAALYARLTDSRRSSWATLGPDGQPLLSDQPDRLADAMRQAIGRYRVFREDNRYVLRGTLPGGSRIEAWLDENEENPVRPMMRVRRDEPRSEKPAVPEEQKAASRPAAKRSPVHASALPATLPVTMP
jgi:hypothetical protein